MKRFKKCPVVLLILATSLLFQGIGVRGAQGIYRHITHSAGYEPGFANVFRGAHEGIYPWSGPGLFASEAEWAEAGQTAPDVFDVDIYANAAFPDAVSGRRPDGGISAGAVSGNSVSGNLFQNGAPLGGTVSNNAMLPETPVAPTAVPGASVSADAARLPETAAATESDVSNVPPETSAGAVRADTPSAPPESLSASEETVSPVPSANAQPPETSAGTVPPVPGPVGEDYFDDALFIGDSRTVGLFEYGQMGEHARCYAKTSMTVYDIFEKEKPIVDPGDGREPITVEQALTENQFGKIYMMIGLNEMGTGTAESFVRSYGAAVARIRELQPQALIYIQGIMRVAAQKNEEDPIFNNANIDLRNEMLAGLADGQTIFYLDINEAVSDENGCLFSDWTFDQIHLKAAYYKVWKEYLLNHGVAR